MALMKTSNPALNVNSFSVERAVSGEAMTLPGTVNKTGILLICVVATEAWSWNRFFHAPASDTVLPLVWIGGIGGFIVALVTIFKKEWSPITAPIYTLLEGLALGGISAMLEFATVAHGHPRAPKKYYVPVSRIALAFLLLSLSSIAHAQQYQRNNEPPATCGQYDKIQVPVADVPTAQDRQALASCNSEDLYFGFNHPADPVKGRKCAYIEREKGVPDIVFGSAGLLTMIYANGKGAARNFDLALKFACEVDGAAAENDSRFEHLLQLQKEHWKGDSFDLCDDATSGFMQGECAELREKFDRTERGGKLDEITSRWNAS